MKYKTKPNEKQNLFESPRKPKKKKINNKKKLKNKVQNDSFFRAQNSCVFGSTKCKNL